MKKFESDAVVDIKGLGASGMTSGALNFVASNLENWGNWNQNYDYFMVNCYVQKFYMECATEYFAPAGSFPGASTPANYPNIPFIHSALDWDNGGAPSSEFVLRENATYKYRQFVRPFTRKLKPRTNTAIYGGVSTTGYAITPKNTKFDVAYANNLLFYGHRWVIDKFSVGQFGSIRIQGKAYITFLGRIA